MVCSDPPSWLSCFPEKLRLYAGDPHFRAGWRTLQALARERAGSVDELWSLGSVLFKADSVLTGRLTRGLQLLEQHCIRPSAARAVDLTPRLVRDFWHYSLGRLSEERIVLLGRLMSQAPCLYVLASTADPGSRLPAALRITELKGAVAPEHREPHHLRRAMGRPQTEVLNFIHTADEPADVLRELGLLFGEAERSAFLREALADEGRDAAYDTSRRLLANTQRCDLEIADALARLRCRLTMIAADGRSPVLIRDVENLLERLASGSRGLWPDLRRSLDRIGVALSEIDQIVIEGWTVPLQKAARSQSFPSCERRHWEACGPAR